MSHTGQMRVTRFTTKSQKLALWRVVYAIMKPLMRKNSDTPIGAPGSNQALAPVP